jgi:hypothetical protein
MRFRSADDVVGRAKSAAVIGRLVHHASIFEMNVESYRRRAALDRKRGSRARRRLERCQKRIYAAAPQSIFASICSTTLAPVSVCAISSGGFPSRIGSFSHSHRFVFVLVAENILSQRLNLCQPHDPIGLLDCKRLVLGFGMPLCALGNDKLPDFLIRESRPAC